MFLSSTLENDMKDAKLMETVSLIVLILVIIISPIIIFLVKSATSTIQVKSLEDFCTKEIIALRICFSEFREYVGRKNTTIKG